MQSGQPIEKNVNQATFLVKHQEEVDNLIGKAIEQSEPIFLKEACDIYKKHSLPMHPAVVTCHIIYIVIKLNLNSDDLFELITDEWDKWEKHLLSNVNSKTLNHYLLDRFIMPAFKEKDIIQVRKNYQALKEALAFFSCYDIEHDENNFNKKLQIYVDLFPKIFLSTCLETYNKKKQEIEKDISSLESFINDYLWVIDETPENKIPAYNELLTIKHLVYSRLLSYKYRDASKLKDQAEILDLCLKINEFDAIDGYQHYNKVIVLLAFLEKTWETEEELPDKVILQTRQLLCQTAIEHLRIAYDSEEMSYQYTQISETKLQKLLKLTFIRTLSHYIIYEIYISHLSEKDYFSAIDKTKSYPSHKDEIKKENMTSEIDDAERAIKHCCGIIFKDANLNDSNVKDICDGTIKVINKIVNDKNPEEQSIKIIFSHIIRNYRAMCATYQIFISEYENAIKSNNLIACQKIALKLYETLNVARIYSFTEMEINLLYLSIKINLNLAYETKEKVYIERVRIDLMKYNNVANKCIFDFDIFCQYQPLGIKIYETFHFLTKIKINKDIVKSGSDPINEKKIYSYLAHRIYPYIFYKLTTQKIKYFELFYDDTKSLTENILDSFEALEKYLQNIYANDQQKQIAIFLFTESFLELLQDETLIILKDLYIALVNKQLDTIRHLLSSNENKTLNNKQKSCLLQIYLDRYHSISFNANENIDHLVLDELINVSLLKEVCNLYKISSRSMHPNVVKCHIIYMAINLELDVNNELIEWEKYFSKNSDANLNSYLLTRFIKPEYENKDPVKLGKAYRALKDALSFFNCYDDDENFKNQLKIYYKLFQTDIEILDKCINTYNRETIKFIDKYIIAKKVINNDEKVKVKNYLPKLKKYDCDYLWIIDEIPQEKTERYKILLNIKYNLYDALHEYTTIIQPSDTLQLCLTISGFDAIHELHHFQKAVAMLASCEIQWIKEDHAPDTSVLKDRQMVCKNAIYILREALNSSEKASGIQIALVRSIAAYINYEFYLSDIKTTDKPSIYTEYRNELINYRNELGNVGLELKLGFTLNYSCLCIFMNTDFNNIQNIHKEAKKIITELLNGKTSRESDLKKWFFQYINEFLKSYQRFHEIEVQYRNSLKTNNVKEYKKVIDKVHIFLNYLRKIDSKMYQMTFLENSALFINTNINLALACLTREKKDIASAKEALAKFNQNNSIIIDFNIFCKYNLLGIKFYETIPFLENIKKSFQQNSTEPAIYNYLTRYLLAMIRIFTGHNLEKYVPIYDDNKSLTENYLINFEIIQKELYKNSDNQIEIILVSEALLELFLNTTIKDTYKYLYDFLVKKHLNNIKNLLLRDKNTTFNNEDKSYLFNFYFEKYNSIMHEVNESDDDSVSIYSQFDEYIKSIESVKANNIINDVIDRFPSVQLFKIKLSLLKDSYDAAVIPVVSIDNKELTVSILPEKQKPNNQNETKLQQYKDYILAYKNLTDKLEVLSKCQEKYKKESEDLDRLSCEIKTLYTAINQIDIEQQVTSDVLLKLKNDIKMFDEKNNAITELKKVLQVTTKNLQNYKSEFDNALIAYVKEEKKFIEFKLKRALARKQEDEMRQKEKEEKITRAAAKKAEQEARKEAEAKRKAQEKEAATKAQEETARKAEEERVAERKAAEEAERKAAEEIEAERKAAEEKEAERKAAEEKEAERKAAEEIEVERKAAEEKDAERKAAEEEAENAAEGETERKAADEIENEIKAEETEAERKAAEEEKIKEDMLLNGSGTKIHLKDLDHLYSLHKELESEGIKLKIKGSFAARFGIYFYHKTPEIAKLFCVNDIDLLISYFEGIDLELIRKIISKYNYVIDPVEKKNFLNVKKAKTSNEVNEIEFDLTLDKLPLEEIDKFMPFHFLHLEIIDKEQIKENDKIIPIGKYYFKLCIEEGYKDIVENACKLEEFLVVSPKPSDNFRYYSYSLFKYLEKLSDCKSELNLWTKVSKTKDFLPVNVVTTNQKEHLIPYLRLKLQSDNYKIFYEEMKRFVVRGITKGKEIFAHPFIRDFYFALLQNKNEFKGFLIPTDIIYNLSVKCADAFIEKFVKNKEIKEKIINDEKNYESFLRWKKTVNTIGFGILNEYKKEQVQLQQKAFQEEFRSQQQAIEQFRLQQQAQEQFRLQQQAREQFRLQQQAIEQFRFQQQAQEQYLLQQQAQEQFRLQQQAQEQYRLQQQAQEQFRLQQAQEQFRLQQQTQEQYRLQQHAQEHYHLQQQAQEQFRLQNLQQTAASFYLPVQPSYPYPSFNYSDPRDRTTGAYGTNFYPANLPSVTISSPIIINTGPVINVVTDSNKVTINNNQSPSILDRQQSDLELNRGRYQSDLYSQPRQESPRPNPHRLAVINNPSPATRGKQQTGFQANRGVYQSDLYSHPRQEAKIPNPDTVMLTNNQAFFGRNRGEQARRKQTSKTNRGRGR